MALLTGTSERRQNKRYPVEWPAMLDCLFPGHKEIVAVSVSEISATGARLELQKLSIGSYHIVVASEWSEFTLHVDLPGIILSAKVKIIWYSMDDKERSFIVGLLFRDVTAADWVSIEKVLNEKK